MPPSIQVLLASRLDLLGREERQVLERAAVEGQRFHRERGRAALRPALRRIRRQSCRRSSARSSSATSGDDEFRFRHLLIRDAAYDAMPKQVRGVLHERFADWAADEREEELTSSSATTSSRRRATGARSGGPIASWPRRPRRGSPARGGARSRAETARRP